MTLQELVKMTGQLPKHGKTESGTTFETDVQPNGKLGFIATIWETNGTGYREQLMEYGTGDTEEKATKSLINKILK